MKTENVSWQKQLPEISNRLYLIKNFPILRQETDHTCGPASARMVLKYFGYEIDESKLALKCLTLPPGTIHWTLKRGFEYYLNKIGYGIYMSENEDNIYENIVSEIQAKRPVVFIYATIDDFHPPNKVIHYGVLIGINEIEKKVLIANPFGKLEEMPIEEWWNRFSLLPQFLTTFQIYLVKLRLLKPRTAFIIKPK